MNKEKRDFAIFNITEDRCIDDMTKYLEEYDYNYRVYDTRFNETIIDVLDSNDKKIVEGRVSDSKPVIKIECIKPIVYQGRRIQVTEQDINAFYGI